MYTSLEDIVLDSKEKNLPFWKVIQLDDIQEENITEQESYQKMLTLYQAMKDSITNYDPSLHSQSNLVGTDGEKLKERREEGKMLCSSFISTIMERAIKVAESNACMKRIVAAPTAGSCGILPAVLVTLQQEKNYTDEKMVEALYVAAGIGSVISARASLAGAYGGCQAEIGSASAMAAGAVTYLEGGSNQQILSALSFALKGLLGLVCDPVAGLVEVPCVKRNVIGSVNAITSSDMALAGIETKIPADEVIDAMKSVGHMMHQDLKETGMGGLAACPTAKKIAEEISKHTK